MTDFLCMRCGGCCAYDVRLTSGDKVRFLRGGIDLDSVVDHVNGAIRKEDGKCMFLTKKNSCGVYEFRPDACRRFPVRVDGIDHRCRQRIKSAPLIFRAYDEAARFK